MLADVVRVQELDVGGARKVLAEHVARAGLEGLLVAHHRFDAPGEVRAGELLAVRLAALDDRDGQPFLGHLPVAFEAGRDLFLGLLLGGMEGVSLLPQELRRAQEEPRPQLPPNDVVPDVHLERQVAVGLDPVLHAVGDDRLAGRADREPFIERLSAGVGDPGDLRIEALDVLGFLLQQRLRHEQREVDVVVPGRLDIGVQLPLHRLPDRVAVRPDDHAAAYRRVVGQFALQDDVVVPPREVLGLPGDAIDETLFGHAVPPRLTGAGWSANPTLCRPTSLLTARTSEWLESSRLRLGHTGCGSPLTECPRPLLGADK